jgi:hypothetical protein
MNLRTIEEAIKNRKQFVPTEKKISEEELKKAQANFEKRQQPEYQKIDFFLSARSHPNKPEHSLQEEQAFIIASLQDHRREDMLFWLQDKFSSSYHISKIPEISPKAYYCKITPIEDKWKVLYHEESAAHSWQISENGIWDESGDVSDVGLQIYENGYILMAHGMDVRGFRL